MVRTTLEAGLPSLNRPDPLYRQIAEHYKQRIITGKMAPGSPFPSVRVIAREWKVAQNVAQRAHDHLKAEGLVRAVPGEGTFVDGHRAKYGPQQRARAISFPASERVEVRAAEVIPSPEYVIPLLGLEPGADVLRREWVTYEDGDVPFMLSVSWHPPQVAVSVPELLALLPPPTVLAATIIADRTGRDRDQLKGHLWFETRQVKADGREGPLLRLPKTALIQAVTYTVASGEDVLEYGEYIILPGRVGELDWTP
jgi:GntR family transcriptional regulator